MEQTSKIIIKKYPNRRLYNTQSSTYIKLDDLALMVKKDEPFVVLDAKTNQDITRLTLVQIVLDHESNGYELMPEDFIKMIIKFYGHPINKMMQDYISQSVKNLNALSLDKNVLEQASDFAQTNINYFTDSIFGTHKDDTKNK
ncbi:MAG: polyhydroxyalkanoate synthesis repressor PhaR [Candidatus Jidaibacter sp.]|nr:polyhydroxyalkanoate synthesis repressor PhaR [Candidatus Jidaibacter sp.]